MIATVPKRALSRIDSAVAKALSRVKVRRRTEIDIASDNLAEARRNVARAAGAHREAEHDLYSASHLQGARRSASAPTPEKVLEELRGEPPKPKTASLEDSPNPNNESGENVHSHVNKKSAWVGFGLAMVVLLALLIVFIVGDARATESPKDTGTLDTPDTTADTPSGSELPGTVMVEGSPAAPDRVIVAYEKDVTQTEQAEVRDDVGAELVDGTLGDPDGSLEVVDPDVPVVDAIEEIEKNPEVLYAEPDYAQTSDWQPNDPYVDSGAFYAVPHLNAFAAWDNTQRGEVFGKGTDHPEIAILDSGIETSHPEFEGKVTYGLNCIGTSQSPFDDIQGHGTSVAGVAGARANNGYGIAGLAPKADMWSGLVAGTDGIAYVSDVIECGNFASANRDVEAMNYSYSGTGYSQAFADAIARWTTQEGVNFVTSVGNEGCPSAEVFPAGYPYAIGVAATRKDYEVWPESQCQNVDISAPGDDIDVPLATGGMGNKDGTSFAAPMIAAGFAGCRAEGFFRGQCVTRMENTATDLRSPGKDYRTGYGRANLNAWWK